MRNKVMILSCLICVIVLSAGHELSWAKSKKSSKIGVVDLRKVFQQCKRNVKYREEATAEQNTVMIELEKLSKEIEAGRLGLQTLKSDSTDYMAAVKELLTKQAKLQAQQEFYKQQLEMKDQRWTEQLYQDIINATGKVAEEKGLDVVLENEQPEFPAMSANDLMMSIRTNKVLYSGGCHDITDDVIAKIDTVK